MQDGATPRTLSLGTAAADVLAGLDDPERRWRDFAEISARVGEATERFEATPGQGRVMRRALRTKLLANTAGERRRITASIRSAKRFRIDREFVSHVAETTIFAEPDEVPGLMTLARLPFPKVWLEIDSGHLDPTLDGRGGYLVERLADDDPTRWIVSMFYVDGRGRFEPTYFDYVLSCDGGDIGPLPVPYERLDGSDGSPVRIPAHHNYSGLHEPRNADDPTPFEAPFGYRLALALSTMPLHEALRRVYPVTDSAKESRHAFQSRSIAGRLRFIVALLATLNHLEHVVEPYVPSRDATRGGPATLRKAVAVDTIKLVLGSPSHGGGAADPFGEAVRRRLHDVRGHWRTYRHEDGSVRMRVWVREHSRGTGDAATTRSYAATAR